MDDPPSQLIGVKRKGPPVLPSSPSPTTDNGVVTTGVETDPDPPKFSREKRRDCPYLDTINRNVLDFDFEKLCSVSLSHLNVYGCLICGKYFQGKGKNTHAYDHSVQVYHHVFLNLHTLKFYCLPDNYEIIDSSLDDIKFVLNPTYTSQNIVDLDVTSRVSRAYDGTTYVPGVVGLNNIKANDYCNVVLQALGKIPPLRDFFLREENYTTLKRPPGDILSLLTQRFGELARKMWNPRNFKAHVSPHEMLQSVVLCSRKKFQITEQGDPITFLSWLLNSLHVALNGTKKADSSVIYRTFQGEMKIYSRKLPAQDMEEGAKQQFMRTAKATVEHHPFLYLTLDLPTAPLYKDEVDQNFIPQVPMYQLLTKFNCSQEKEYKTFKDSTMKRFELTKLPPYLIMFVKRFTVNRFFIEKNNTIVNFPVKGVDLQEFLSHDPEVRKRNPCTTYDLIANIIHDGDPNKGTYRVHCLHKGSGKWVEMQDLHVTDILPQMIALSECYIQFYELNKRTPPTVSV